METLIQTDHGEEIFEVLREELAHTVIISAVVAADSGLVGHGRAGFFYADVSPTAVVSSEPCSSWT